MAAPLANRGTLAVDALAVLHRLAIAPDSFGDSLMLLHELQTYQVELDLQYEQLLENEREIQQELARYKALYEAAPAGYLIVDPHGAVVEGNQAAADLLGVRCGEPLCSCPVSVGGDTVRSHGVRINARVAPDSDAILMILCDCGCPTTAS